MILKLSDQIKINVLTSHHLVKNYKDVIFLHGFSGSSNDFKYFLDNLPDGYNGYAFDLLGHGKSSSPKDLKKYLPKNQIKIIEEIFNYLSIKNPVIIGYSMGGRMALAYTNNHPHNVKALLLESASFGYLTELEKQNRIENDIKLADKIISDSLEDFFHYWLNIPLFDDLKKLSGQALSNLKQNKIQSNNKIGLANSLIGFSTGRMEYYLEKTDNFKLPVFLVTGENDQKFTSIAKKANELLIDSKHIIFKNCGHNVHLQKPQEFLNLIISFLLKLKET